LTSGCRQICWYGIAETEVIGRNDGESWVESLSLLNYREEKLRSLRVDQEGLDLKYELD